MTTIRRLAKGEWPLYRQVRLAALKDAPEAFSTTYESASQRSPESWAAQADAAAEGSDRFTFLVLKKDEPVGLASLYRDADGSGQGEMIQVWIAPALRGGRLAGELLDFIFRTAQNHGFGRIRAEVFMANERARRFYEKHGFTREDAPGMHDPHSIVLSKIIACA